MKQKNRRLPAVQVLRVEPGDVILLEFSEPLSMEDAAELAAPTKQLFPGNSVLVVDSGVRVRVLREVSE